MDSLSTQLFCSIWRFGTCAANSTGILTNGGGILHTHAISWPVQVPEDAVCDLNKPCIELKPEYVIQLLIKMYRPTHNHI